MIIRDFSLPDEELTLLIGFFLSNEDIFKVEDLADPWYNDVMFYCSDQHTEKFSFDIHMMGRC